MAAVVSVPADEREREWYSVYLAVRGWAQGKGMRRLRLRLWRLRRKGEHDLHARAARYAVRDEMQHRKETRGDVLRLLKAT